MTTTGSPSLRISPATPGDVPLIVSLIRELAAYERLPDEAVATERMLAEALFGERPAAHALVARVAADTVGFALYFFNFSTFIGRPGLYLEDLYVRPAWRGRGVGRALLTALAQVARDRECRRMEWAVLDWNEPAIRFYQSLGARPLRDWTVFRLEDDGIRSLADDIPGAAETGAA